MRPQAVAPGDGRNGLCCSVVSGFDCNLACSTRMGIKLVLSNTSVRRIGLLRIDVTNDPTIDLTFQVASVLFISPLPLMPSRLFCSIRSVSRSHRVRFDFKASRAHAPFNSAFHRFRHLFVQISPGLCFLVSRWCMLGLCSELPLCLPHRNLCAVSNGE